MLPEETETDASPPSPLRPLLRGALMASQVLPESPPMTTLLLEVSPEYADPSAEGLDVVFPDSPVLPELPELAVPELVP